MTLNVEVQRATASPSLPSDDQLRAWALAAVSELEEGSELLIRLVDETESAALNGQYRGKPYATNVLSFPAEVPEEIDEPALGDLVVCAPVVQREAVEQGKAELAHWAHMIVHGVLHLRGYDHIEEGEAEKMERLETGILESLGFADPYQSHQE